VDDGSTDGTREAIAEFLPGSATSRAPPGSGGGAKRRDPSGEGRICRPSRRRRSLAPGQDRVQVEAAERHPEAGMIVCDGVQFSGDEIIDGRSSLSLQTCARLLDHGEAVGISSATTSGVPGSTARRRCSSLATCSERSALRGLRCAGLRLLPEAFAAISDRGAISFVREVAIPPGLDVGRSPGASAALALDALPVLEAHRERCRPGTGVCWRPRSGKPRHPLGMA